MELDISKMKSLKLSEYFREEVSPKTRVIHMLDKKFVASDSSPLHLVIQIHMLNRSPCNIVASSITIKHEGTYDVPKITSLYILCEQISLQKNTGECYLFRCPFRWHRNKGANIQNQEVRYCLPNFPSKINIGER